jgi:hypothetical protein
LIIPTTPRQLENAMLVSPFASCADVWTDGRHDGAVTPLHHFYRRMTTLPRNTRVSVLNFYSVRDHLSTPNESRSPTNCLTNTSRLSINFIKAPDWLG